MKIDLHVHTNYSKDSMIRPGKLPEVARKKGLDGFAVTDHGTTEGLEEVKKASDGMIIVPGIEVSTEKGEILGLFVDEEIGGKRPQEVVDKIKSAGGLAVVPHPFRTFGGLDGIEKLKRLDGVEVFNSRNLLGMKNRRARKFAEENGFIKTAGSDAHTTWEVGNAYVEAEAENLEEFKEKLEEGKTAIKGSLSNPLYHMISTINKFRR
ncbi:MAG: PHP domain-containing protein [Candidatus Aenigmatarchaeota archaeon]